jgi:hypothetical protein
LDSNLSNFREVCIGSIKPGILYRSGHPIPYPDKQDKIIAESAIQARIVTVLNLSDSKARLERNAFLAPWYNNLYQKGRVLALGMKFDILDKRFPSKMKQGVRFIIEHEGPYLIHCYSGIDRTGFVCALIEALMGAGRYEIVTDYLRSFEVDSTSTWSSNQYLIMGFLANIFGLLARMNNGTAITDENIQMAAENYLFTRVKLSSDEIQALKRRLSRL